MPKNNTSNVSLTGFDSIFKSTISSNTHEEIVLMPLDELHHPDFHPFHVNDDIEMERLVKSVKKYGVREPGIVRIKDDGTHELLAGFRRKRASELAEIPHMPVIINDSAMEIEAVGRSVGYNSADTFRRAFKRVMGISPSNYRRL